MEKSKYKAMKKNMRAYPSWSWRFPMTTTPGPRSIWGFLDEERKPQKSDAIKTLNLRMLAIGSSWIVQGKTKYMRGSSTSRWMKQPGQRNPIRPAEQKKRANK